MILSDGHSQDKQHENALNRALKQHENALNSHENIQNELRSVI